MLHKKRDQFRKEIRRQQLDKYRQQKRKQLIQHMLNNDIFNQINQIWTDIQSCLISIAQKNYHLIKQSIKQSMLNRMEENSHKFEHKQDQQNFYTLVSHFHKLKSIAPSEYEQIFTKYMMNKQSAQKVLKIFNDVLQNEWNFEDEEGNEWLQDTQAKKYPSVIRTKVITEIIKFIDTLGFIAIGIDVLRTIIDSFWNLINDGSKILLSQVDNYDCLRLTLSILTKLLEDNKNPLNYQYMQQKGLGTQLVKFIDRLRKLSVPLQIHSCLLQLIDNYLNCEMTQSHPKASQKIGQVTIQTSKVNQKQILLVYCIVFIDKSQESLYSIVFACISKILEIHQFLVDNLKQEYWKKVCHLILHQSRDIQVEALNLLNDFTYHSQHVLDFLLGKSELFDILYKRLMIEKSTHDHFVTPCVEKIAYIICNSLLTENNKLKKDCLNHHIWEEIFNSLHPSMKLFPLIMTMPYFFTARGHKNFDKYFRPYVETLKNFEWQPCRYTDSIKDSIKETFYKASQQWQDYQYILFLNILQQQGFLFLIEDLVEKCDLDKIKDIQIQ